jgi:hypothetical protein
MAFARMPTGGYERVGGTYYLHPHAEYHYAVPQATKAQ